jgi:hypothetical protein
MTERYVNPDHYKRKTIEAIEVMEQFSTDEEFVGHLKNTALKYLLRLNDKDTPLMNARKCQWYVERLVTKLENGD